MYLINLEKYQKISFIMTIMYWSILMSIHILELYSSPEVVSHLLLVIFAGKHEKLFLEYGKCFFFLVKMNIPPHLKLFDSCVKPILLYCSKIWSLDSLVNNRSNLENKYLLFPTC